MTNELTQTIQRMYEEIERDSKLVENHKKTAEGFAEILKALKNLARIRRRPK